MAKFCSKCGNPLNEGVMFCTKCGAPQAAAPQQPVAPQQPAYQPAPVYTAPSEPSPLVKVLMGKVTEGKTALLLLGEQLLTLFLFFLPMLSLSLGKKSEFYSLFYYLDTGDNTAIIHTILLLALIVSFGLLLIPCLKANGLEFKKPFPLSDKLLPLVTLGASVALFIANLVTIIMFCDDLGDLAGLSVWGVFYLIFFVLSNAHLGFCWWKSNN